jgi:hypothetical protein
MMRDGRFLTDYSIWGETLDVEQLLAKARPRGRHEVWRRGDLTLLGTPATTSGLTMRLYHGSSQEALSRAVDRFLRREAHFLRLARQRRVSGTHSGVSTFICVGADELLPVGVELPTDVLQRIGMAGLSWTVGASVFMTEANDRKKGRHRPTRG